MTHESESELQRVLMRAFRMPAAQTLVSRKSSITNAFVSAIIPVVYPSWNDIREAVEILGLNPHDLRCAYCNDRSTEWDHLRPLVVNRRPTGYVSEIANLVPACGKCNQSKGNKHWREWMLSNAKWSPTGRGLGSVAERIHRLEAFEQWRIPTKIEFRSVIGDARWDEYWQSCEELVQKMAEIHCIADELKKKTMELVGSGTTPE